MMRKLKIIDQLGSVDGLYLLGYICLMASFTEVFWNPFPVLSFVSLASFSLITYRDEVLRVKSRAPIDDLIQEVSNLKSEVSSLKIQASMKGF